MPKHLFGIFSPVLGEKKDYPVILLDKTIQADNRNIIVKYGEIHRRKMREPDLLDIDGIKSITPDSKPIIHYHTHIERATNVQYLLGFTEKHIYVWLPDNYEWEEIFTVDDDNGNGGVCEEWDSVSFNNKIIVTNNLDNVQVWDTTGNFTELCDYKAKYVTAFENYLILGATTESGTYHPQRIRWSDLGDEGIWDTGDAGSAETEGSDFITGFNIYQGALVIFKEKSRIIQRLVATSDVWNWAVLPGAIGCRSNHSIVEDPLGRVFWLDTDLKFREMQTGVISDNIDPIVSGIEPSSDYLVYGFYISETGEIWWSIPYKNRLNNKILTFKDGLWGELDISAPAIGEYKEGEINELQPM